MFAVNNFRSETISILIPNSVQTIHFPLHFSFCFRNYFFLIFVPNSVNESD